MQVLKKNYFPLDDVLGIANGTKYSLGATEAVLSKAADLLYAKTSKYMEKLAQIEVSPQTILYLARIEGSKAP